MEISINEIIQQDYKIVVANLIFGSLTNYRNYLVLSIDKCSKSALIVLYHSEKVIHNKGGFRKLNTHDVFKFCVCHEREK
jgi:hypothetical protein